MGAGADTWRLCVLHVNDHLAGGRLIGQRAPRPELQHVAPQAHLPLQLFGPLRAGLYVPGQLDNVSLSFHCRLFVIVRQKQNQRGRQMDEDKNRIRGEDRLPKTKTKSVGKTDGRRQKKNQRGRQMAEDKNRIRGEDRLPKTKKESEIQRAK